MENVRGDQMTTPSALFDRRPIYLIDTPCLTRQYTFRPDESFDPVKGTDRTEAKKKRRSIAAFLNDYLDNLQIAGSRFDVENLETINAEQTHLKSRFETVFVTLDRDDDLIDISIEMHTEYFTVSFRAYPAAKRANDAVRLSVQKKMESLSIFHGVIKSDLSNEEAVKQQDDVEEANLELIFDQYWTEVLGGTTPKQKKNTHDVWNDPIEFLNQVDPDFKFTLLATFSGIVLRRADGPDSESASKQYTKHKELAKHRSNDSLSYNPRAVSEEFLDDDSICISGTALSQASVGTALKEVGPDLLERRFHVHLSRTLRTINNNFLFFTRLLGFRRAPQRDSDYFGGNSVLCGMLDGLAVYGSSFGRWNEDNDKQNDVRYFIIYSGPSRNQLSRLVQRIHSCGENRILALADFEEIRRAAEALDRILGELDRLVKDKAVTPGKLAELRQESAKLSERFRAGLAHRIGRTAYYWTTLQRRTDTLRIKRVVGWQTYEEFIYRNLEPQVQTFLRTGDKLEQVDKKIAETEALFLTNAAYDLQFFGAPVLILSGCFILSEVIVDLINHPLALGFPLVGGSKDFAIVVARLGLLISSVALSALVFFINLKNQKNQDRKPQQPK
tara:strand:- start:80 stop:1924 length:1845 start_codon:yes stop_codon:yes gene_type:complete